MATIKNIKVPHGVWVDLYAAPEVIAAGISAGTSVLIQNVGASDLFVNSDTLPPINAGFSRVEPSKEAKNTSGDLNAWVKSERVDGSVQVKLAV